MEARVRLLECCTEKVHDAELEERDRRSAQELDEVTAEVVRAGAAHPRHTEAFASLVEAPRAAPRVAALTGVRPGDG